MTGAAMLWPVFALVGLTFLVWCRMFVVRVGQMKRERIHPQSVATSSQAAARLTDSKVADNLRNLFELPVLFYAAALIAAFAGLATPVLLVLAWLFVALRIAHSAIHCTYNKVMHRFVAYLAGGIVLWLLWAYLAYLLLA
ncbi:MAG TPA: MAPEG family protein [Luteimonas sp.]|nr:MAPEG family protein [Luteimonas sp.]